uniref:Uncharacterized protein n=1 Tax=Lates calcarifer TaxID=8187 RepID=A0A4W6FTS0_LATCA
MGQFCIITQHHQPQSNSDLIIGLYDKELSDLLDFSAMFSPPVRKEPGKQGRCSSYSFI